MPHRQHAEAAVARIEVDALLEFVELRNEITMTQHDALWSARSARSENDCCEIVPLTLVKFRFNNIVVLYSKFTSALHHIIKTVQGDIFLRSVGLLFLFDFIKRNELRYERKIVMY